MPVEGTPTTSGYEGRYTTEDAVEQYIGEFNLTSFADVDADGDRDAGAVEQAIDSAEARVDFHTGGAYTFPVSDPVRNQTVAADTFEWWARVLATIAVARKRFILTDSHREEFKELRDEVVADMEAFRDLPSRLPGAVPDNEDDTPDDGEPGGLEAVTIDRGDGATDPDDEDE